ncbi:type I-E CRISPR-associated protein Cas5/CasD [Amycolatopsis aidingensis]|uniref:type I-E CRISPR-associated protein Cas5/CasD n=1 Tax=Amycolatopsis aidingensis TaxID=2842453 RepID=UPI001C0C16D8|nr:type I-E CRISPR-associated protein Cas5/CasD [Amycolatopsis aidingensis]
MSALLLRLAGPLQSWGTSSRFTRRNTDRAPSKSGVIGLLAAAEGRARNEPIEDLGMLRIGVRIDQAGRVERDFQTARPVDGSAPLPLSYRFYLADAVFLVAVEGAHELLERLASALRTPVFPLYLGRRSCPPAGPVLLGLREGTAGELLRETPWQASGWFRRRHSEATVSLETVTDCRPGTPGSVLVRDEPVSFDPRHRQYEWRSVLRAPVTVSNPDHRAHDPMELLGGDG